MIFRISTIKQKVATQIISNYIILASLLCFNKVKAQSEIKKAAQKVAQGVKKTEPEVKKGAKKVEKGIKNTSKDAEKALQKTFK